MPKVLKSAAREMVLKVKRSCEEERDNNGPLVPFNKVRARVAFLTGVSERTVSNITKEGHNAESQAQKVVTPGKKRNRKQLIDLDDFDYCAIRHKINEFYVVKKQVPTINTLWMELKNDIDFKYSRTSLRRILKVLGYKFQRCQSKRKVLMERPDIAAWRAKYLMRLRKNRQEKRPVVYLDETYIHASYLPQKCWQGPDQPGVLSSDSVGARWIIAHAGGKKGFVNNGLLVFKSKSKSSDYHDDMNADNFTRWMTHNILPNLDPKTLVVMDNASYHCKQINKAPTMGNLKADLQAWLREKKIPFDENWTKPQLIQLIKENKGEPVYEIEDLLNQRGHEVVRLPPYHCDLNPIEKIWAIMKRRVAINNVGQNTQEIEDLTRNAFQTISDQEWQNVCQHVEKIEDQYYESDHLMDIELDKFIISFDSDSDTSSDSEDEDENFNDGVRPLLDHNYYKKI